ncbi:DUF262 domain-containing protein [Candidatus Peregrinibacteria bacterium]|nr:DUF262 domain-containing protein [Candidatus Peregrinibacteria bacterium]
MTTNKELCKDTKLFAQEEYDDESLALKGPIISYGADYTLDSIRQYVNDSKQIIVQPSFQREFVWDIKKASKLIESFILGYPVPNILLGRDPETETMEVIDGQQRILSICDFFRGRFRDEKIFKLSGDIDNKYIGKTFDELEESLQKKLKNAVLKAVVLVYPKDDPNIKYAAFQRINTGSVVLNQQEIRNCIYGGSLNDLLFELNEKNTTWRKILAKKIDKRMKDVETILRFFAAYFNGGGYEKPITQFLNTFMEKNRNVNPKIIEAWKELFSSTLESIVNEVGAAFPHTAETKTFNRAVFESVMTAVAHLKKEGKFRKGTLKKNYTKLLQDTTYIDSVTAQTSDKKRYKDRIAIATKVLA